MPRGARAAVELRDIGNRVITTTALLRQSSKLKNLCDLLLLGIYAFDCAHHKTLDARH